MKEIVIDAVFATSNFFNRAQLVIHPESGLILSFNENVLSSDKVDHFFDEDCIAFAGMGDIHIHAREDVSQKHLYKESYESASKAALNGGLVHVADMPNNPIPPIDDESYKNKFALTLKYPVSYLLYAGVGPQTHPLSFHVPYKVYMGPSIGELYFRNLKELDETISRYQNKWVSFHCEDPVLLEKNKNQATHFERRPVEAEVLATRDAINLIEKYNLRGKLCHYSSGEGLQLIRKKRKEGLQIEIEATPQHLFYSQEKINPDNITEFQMNPPIRSEDDREYLLEAFKKGEINFLATDHAPHSPAEKHQGMSGLTGLDTYGAFVTWLIQKEKMSPQKLAIMTSENPGQFANEFLTTLNTLSAKSYGNGFGFLKPGFLGNVSVLKLNSPYQVTPSRIKSKAMSSPFLGVTFPGRVEAVFIRGINLT